MDIKDIIFNAIDNIAEGVVITTSDLDEPGPQIIFVNKAMERLTGYAAEEMIGKTPRILQGERTNREDRKYLKEQLLAKQAFGAVIENHRKDGSIYWVELTISPIYDNEQLTYWMAIQREITQEIELLNKAEVLAAVVNELRDRFNEHENNFNQGMA